MKRSQLQCAASLAVFSENIDHAMKDELLGLTFKRQRDFLLGPFDEDALNGLMDEKVEEARSRIMWALKDLKIYIEDLLEQMGVEG